jgi:hypothetical protein
VLRTRTDPAVPETGLTCCGAASRKNAAIVHHHKRHNVQSCEQRLTWQVIGLVFAWGGFSLYSNQ